MTVNCPIVGDFVIVDLRRYGARYQGGFITKVTPKLVFYNPYFMSGIKLSESRVNRLAVVYSGDEKIGKKLQEQIRSAEVQKDQERHQSNIRYAKCCEELITKANLGASK